MADNPPRPAYLRYRSDDLPEKDRLRYWREVFAREVVKLEIKPLTEEPFHASLTLANLPGCQLILGSNSPVSVQLTQELIDHSNDDLYLPVILNSGASIIQHGHELAVEQGEATLLSLEEIGIARGITWYFNIRLPLQRMKALVPDIETRIAQRIPRNAPALRLLTGYIETGAWQSNAFETFPVLSQTFADHIADLVALTLLDANAARETRHAGLLAAHLANIRGEIRRSAFDPRFSLPELALRVGISPRYVQMLLSEQDTSFTKEVARHRLERARHLLGSRRWRHLPVADIALQCGFASVEHFRRMFRGYFGLTPGDVRNALTTS
jgi:AraC-like DNA-binding protein